MKTEFNIQQYVQHLAIEKAAKIAHADHQKEQAKANLQREVNHNSVNFNYHWPWKMESNLMNIDRSVFKKSKAERLLSNALRSEYKIKSAGLRAA